MIETSNKLPDWIKRQASLGPNVKVDGKRTEDNFYWYLLTLCCPLIFDRYAIILHPYWINWKAKDLITSGLTLTEDQFDGRDFRRINWTDFFRIFDYDFNLETANQTQEKIRKQLLKSGKEKTDWPGYIWFPGEGNCETEEFEFIISNIADQEVNFYYCLLKTNKWEEEKVFRGRLSEFEKLAMEDDLRSNPTAVYPDDKSWCIVSDYDLPFTYIGGTKELIESLVPNKNFDIHKIEPVFKEQPENEANN